MPNSIFDAIQQGQWNYDPEQEPAASDFSSTGALPGTTEKLSVLAERIRRGLPLWHPSDRHTYDDNEPRFGN